MKTTSIFASIPLLFLLLTGCSEKTIDENIEPNLVIGASLENFKLNDQFGTEHGINADTRKIIFAFEKDSSHSINDYLETKPASYLKDNNAIFVSDVSAAPTLIKNIFIMPGLKAFKHSVLIFEDKSIAAPYRVGVDEEAIVLVYLSDKKITAIEKVIPTKEALIKFIEQK